MAHIVGPVCIMLIYRVKGMLYINVLAITAGLLMGLAKMGTPYLMVIAGRAIMGLYCGKTEPCLYCHGILREKQGKAFIKNKT